MPDKDSSAKKLKKFRKGDLVKVIREAYKNSAESSASDFESPEYIFEGPGEILLITGEYCQIRWRKPVPDVWLKSDQLEKWNEN
tara:strand:+ start:622 stop:873 length:252 start_codon:yes stop_codon:yes gene_type:complete